MWDERYQADGFVYGKDPNDFLVSAVEQIPAGGKVLSLGEGEGRNAVFLAKRNFAVTAIDLSDVGLQKARKLAQEERVTVETIVADLSTFMLPERSCDVIVSIFCHLPPEIRKRVHANIVDALNPGGMLVLEGFSEDQLAFNSGGPRSLEVLLNLEMLQVELQGLEFMIARQVERDLYEGPLHNGRCSVVQVLAKKPLVP